MEVECCGRHQTCCVLPSAEGRVPAPSTPPPTPSPAPAVPEPATPSLSLDDYDWDWLDEVPITPVVEELERFANSLFAEAHDSQVSCVINLKPANLSWFNTDNAYIWYYSKNK